MVAKKKKKKYSAFIMSKNETLLKKLTHFIPLIFLMIAFLLNYKFGIPFYDRSYFAGGIFPTYFVCSIVYFVYYLYIDIDSLTDNVKANRVLSPLVFIIVLLYASMTMKLPFYSEYSSYYGAVGYSLIFIVNYLYSSSYFQPDLDVSGARPGMTHFPVGKWMAASRYGRFIRWMFYPITRSWFHLWMPFSRIFTHRGITHYPIIGVYLRVLYLWLIMKAVIFMTTFIGIKSSYILYIFNTLDIFFPWNDQFLSTRWNLVCLPIFLSDIVHISVDFVDSIKRGKPFCHPKIPRGLFIQYFREIKDILKKI